MERQKSENNDLQDDVKLEFMLMNLTTNESAKTHLHVHPDTTCPNVSNSLELEEETTCEEQNEFDSTVRSDVDEESIKKSEAKELNKADEGFKGFPDVVPTWERIRLPPCPLYIQTQKKDDKELRTEEPMEAGGALFHNSQKESLSQLSSACTFYLPNSLDRDDVSQTDLKDEACGSSSVPKLTRQRHVHVTSRSGRSASDPEGPHLIQKPKESRSNSAPSVSNLNEYEENPIERSIKDSGNLIKGSSPTGQKDSCNEESFGAWEHMSKIQNKGKKNKFKTLTQKVMGMLKEKPNHVREGSKSSQDSVEEEAQSLSSMEMGVEEPLSPPPLPPKRGRYVHLKRTFTLKDFELKLEPINLMEEVFTGEEWLPYLPSKTSSPQKDAGKQAMQDDVVHPDKDTELHVPQMTTEQNQSENGNTNLSDVKQDIINENDETISELDNKRKDNRHLRKREVHPNACIFAIPKALLPNAAQKQRPRRISSETNNSDHVYECMDTFLIPKNDFLLLERRSLDVYLDFSTVKSLELLDNSALKSRVHLSKKRHHGPPKKYRKEKAEMMFSKFYEIPS